MSALRIQPRCRVVIDNDWAGDPDGLVALAHHLLSPGNRVVGITSTGLDPVFGSPRSAPADGAAVARELVNLLGLDVPVLGGGDSAAEAIVGAAYADDELPLHVVCGGPLTNVAAAIRRDPSIVGQVRLVWVGGSIADSADEYNRDTDRDAACFVLTQPDLAIDQFPVETYRRCAVSVTELEQRIGTAGPLGAFLWRQFVELPLPDFISLGEVWPLGDSPPGIVTALDGVGCTWVGDDHRRVCTGLDVRLLVGDLLAKLDREATR
jgi:inosine-uridine nucleoside N-ribohydrolase